MLVIQLKRGESVGIGEAVVKADKIQGGKVKLSIDAPLHVHVVRGNAKKKEPGPIPGEWRESEE